MFRVRNTQSLSQDELDRQQGNKRTAPRCARQICTIHTVQTKNSHRHQNIMPKHVNLHTFFLPFSPFFFLLSFPSPSPFTLPSLPSFHPCLFPIFLPFTLSPSFCPLSSSPFPPFFPSLASRTSKTDQAIGPKKAYLWPQE